MIRRIVKESFILLNVDYVRLGEKWNYKNVLSPYYRMYYIEDGQGLIYSQKQTWPLEPGNLYLIPSFTLCNLRCSGRLNQYFIHFFEDAGDGISLFHNCQTVFRVQASEMDIGNFKRLLQINPCRKINRSDNPRIYEKHAYYQEYEQLNNSQPYDLFLETQGILLQLVSKFIRLKTQDLIDRHVKYLTATIADAMLTGAAEPGEAGVKSQLVHAFVVGLLLRAKIYNDLKILAYLDAAVFALIGARPPKNISG